MKFNFGLFLGRLAGFTLQSFVGASPFAQEDSFVTGKRISATIPGAKFSGYNVFLNLMLLYQISGRPLLFSFLKFIHG